MSNGITSDVCQSWGQYNDAAVNWVDNHRDEVAIGAISSLIVEGATLLSHHPITFVVLQTVQNFGLQGSAFLHENICGDSSFSQKFETLNEVLSEIPSRLYKLGSEFLESAQQPAGFPSSKEDSPKTDL